MVLIPVNDDRKVVVDKVVILPPLLSEIEHVPGLPAPDWDMLKDAVIKSGVFGVFSKVYSPEEVLNYSIIFPNSVS